MGLNITQDLTFFEDFKVRRNFDKVKKRWFFSVIGIITVLTNQPDYKEAKSYWTTLKSKLKAEGSQLITNYDHLKMKTNDRKFYNTDVADLETIFRLVQSIPIKKAEPIKFVLLKLVMKG